MKLYIFKCKSMIETRALEKSLYRYSNYSSASLLGTLQVDADADNFYDACR